MADASPLDYIREPGVLLSGVDTNPGAGGSGYPWGGTALGSVGEVYWDFSVTPVHIRAEERGGAPTNSSFREMRSMIVCVARGWDSDLQALLDFNPANAGAYLSKFTLLFAPDDRANGISLYLSDAAILPGTTARARLSYGHERRLPLVFYGHSQIVPDLLENQSIA